MLSEKIFRLFMRLQVSVFRRTNGQSMSFMRGMPVLLLNTVGRKSRQVRTTPLMYIRDGENYVVTASNNGRDKHPAWYYNLQGSQPVEIEVPGQHLRVTASIADPAQHKRLWAQLVAQAPFFDDYRKGTPRSIPMVVLHPN